MIAKDDRRLARGRRWFEYHCNESESSSDAELWHHTHQQVQVVRWLWLDDRCPSEGKMYDVIFQDGYKYQVFNDELVKSPSEFERPDYIIGS